MSVFRIRTYSILIRIRIRIQIQIQHFMLNAVTITRPPKRTSKLHLLVIFALLDSDPDFESGSRYGSTDLTESGSGSETLDVPYLQYVVWSI
jgi:hypothetical protein